MLDWWHVERVPLQPSKGLSHKDMFRSHLAQNTVSSFYLPTINYSSLSMATGIFRLPTLVLAILCLGIISESQATLCTTVCQNEPPICPYGQVRSFILAQLVVFLMIYWPCLVYFLREPQASRSVLQLIDPLQPAQFWLGLYIQGCWGCCQPL